MLYDQFIRFVEYITITSYMHVVTCGIAKSINIAIAILLKLSIGIAIAILFWQSINIGIAILLFSIANNPGSVFKAASLHTVEQSVSPGCLVKHCKRIGKVIPEKSQSLLVTLESLDHANIIQSNAKILRKSVNDFVRDNVFINADLTKAEAAAAYEERCRRRQLHHERTSKQQPQQKTNKIQSSTTLSYAGSSSRVIGSIIDAATSDSLLNVTVPEFYPSSSLHTAVGQSVIPLTSTSASVPSSSQGSSTKK